MCNSYKNVYLFTWNVENFSFCNQENGRSIESRFIDENVSEQEWFLILYPRGESDESSNFISCFLELRHNKNYKDFDYGFKIELIGGEELKILEGNVILKSAKKSYVWGDSKMLENNQVMQDIQSNGNDSLTIRCSVYGNNPKKPASDGCTERTRNIVDCRTFQWNFSSGIGQLHRETAIFQNNTSFRITISASLDTMNVCIEKLTSSLVDSHFVKCKISLLDYVQKLEICSEKHSHLFGCDWLFSLDTISRELNNVTCKKVIFLCEFFYSNGDTENLHYLSFQVPNSTFQQDLQNVFSNKKFSDIKLQVGNQIIDAHKAVLASRSPIFYDMVDQNAFKNPLAIVNVDEKSFNLFLKFLYSDYVSKVDFDQAKTLILIAEKYQVLSLKSKCFNILISRLTEKNVCEVLTIADLISDVKLKSCTIDFILANTKKILSCPVWQSWIIKNPKLGSEILFKLKSASCNPGSIDQLEKRT